MKKFYTFLNQLHDSSLKTHFLCHDVKHELDNRELELLTWSCQNKKEDKKRMDQNFQ